MPVSEDASEKATVLAMLGNATVALARLVASAASGWGAMFAEGMHSAADTLNAGLLWMGIRLSRKPADASHPFGYGSERYFWSFVSAIGVFMLGGGATIYFATTIREANRRRGPRTWPRYLSSSTDASLLAVLFEDVVGLLGVLVAAAGIGLAHALGAVRFDAARPWPSAA